MVALARDPLVIKETRVDTIYGLLRLDGRGTRFGAVLEAPLLIMYGAKDEIVPKTPIRRFVGRLSAECRGHARLAWYGDGYHMLRDLEGPIVTADVANWVLDPAAPLPSGADRGATEAFLQRSDQLSLDTR